MATIKHLSSKNSNYAAAESYLTFQHNEYTGLPILDEKGRPKLRDSYLLDTLECGESSFAMACLIANRKYGKNGGREDVKTHHRNRAGLHHQREPEPVRHRHRRDCVGLQHHGAGACSEKGAGRLCPHR